MNVNGLMDTSRAQGGPVGGVCRGGGVWGWGGLLIRLLSVLRYSVYLRYYDMHTLEPEIER